MNLLGCESRTADESRTAVESRNVKESLLTCLKQRGDEVGKKFYLTLTKSSGKLIKVVESLSLVGDDGKPLYRTYTPNGPNRLIAEDDRFILSVPSAVDESKEAYRVTVESTGAFEAHNNFIPGESRGECSVKDKVL